MTNTFSSIKKIVATSIRELTSYPTPLQIADARQFDWDVIDSKFINGKYYNTTYQLLADEWNEQMILNEVAPHQNRKHPI